MNCTVNLVIYNYIIAISFILNISIIVNANLNKESILIGKLEEFFKNVSTMQTTNVIQDIYHLYTIYLK